MCEKNTKVTYDLLIEIEVEERSRKYKDTDDASISDWFG